MQLVHRKYGAGKAHMKTGTGIGLALMLLALRPATGSAPDTQESVRTRAELTDFEETSRYEDVMQFIGQLQQHGPLIHLEAFGQSKEGRALPLLVLSDPPVSSPQEASNSGRPIVFIMANIHAGEVEGKEACQDLARRLLTGDLRPLLKKLVILIAPDYNADGNERISTDNRVAQNGPISGVGIRENAQGLDLNRDYMKAVAPETRALLHLFNRWDPHLVVDLHTTDGSYHGYHLTYSIPLNPNTDRNLADYHRNRMMPALAAAMLSKHKFRTYYYGNFEGRAPHDGQPDTRSWHAFSAAPRVGTNYVGLRNRMAILSEAYSYLDFKQRIDVTEAFVEEIFNYAAEHGDEIRRLTAQADRDAMNRGAFDLGIDCQPKTLPEKVDILVGEVTKLKNTRSGKMMTAVVPDKFTAVKMPDYGMFAPTRYVPSASIYLFAAEPGLKIVIGKLQNHGIALEQLTAPLKVGASSFKIAKISRTTRAFQGGREVKVSGAFGIETAEFPAGTIIVRTNQPLGLLAACLLEPQSDDGLTTWGFLDPYLSEGKTYPIRKLTHSADVSSRKIP
jgi:hypothetical protein